MAKITIILGENDTLLYKIGKAIIDKENSIIINGRHFTYNCKTLYKDIEGSNQVFIDDLSSIKYSQKFITQCLIKNIDVIITSDVLEISKFQFLLEISNNEKIDINIFATLIQVNTEKVCIK